ncbi:hypothetical protein HPB50_014437 [Hyalomma asiaticum]|uniref:Uncharacterized protein n=1 Tax=Hyalomma asiaticum TaxID=266040 RepID=A0ACB7TKK9_HYAAI|nr:hypothetical protein HPB50_014437 [Hyalomma asiaticum]
MSSETSSDSRETSINGRRSTVADSGDTPSADHPDSSNTADGNEREVAQRNPMLPFLAPVVPTKIAVAKAMCAILQLAANRQHRKLEAVIPPLD